MCVVSHGYGGSGGGRDGGGMHAGQSQGGWWNVGEYPECQVETLMTPDHTAVQVRSSG